MTVSVTNRSPTAGTTASKRALTRFHVADDTGAVIDPTAVDVWLCGLHAIDAGIPGPGSSISVVEFGALDIVVGGLELVDDDVVTIHVTCGALDDSWTWTTDDETGPRLKSTTPPAYSIVDPTPTALGLILSRTLVREVDLALVNATFAGNTLTINHWSSASAVLTGPVAGKMTLAKSGGLAFDVGILGQNITIYDAIVPANIGRFAITDVDDGDHLRFTNAAGVAGPIGDWEIEPYPNLEGREGHLFAITSGPETGTRRRLTTINGPGSADFDGVPLAPGIGDVDVYSSRGLDVHVDGTRIIHCGYLDYDAEIAGWVATATQVGDDVVVAISTVPVTWADGYRLPINIRAHDAAGNESEITYVLDIVDVRGPQVFAITPAEGTRGLSTSSDLVLDILCPRGVDTTTLDIVVSGIQALSAGVGVGIYSTSTVAPVTGGQRITLKRATAYADGQIVFVDVNVDDDDGCVGERRVLRYQFGATVDDQAVVHDLGGNDIVRILAPDLTTSSFADPETRGHTGFAWDGYWYEAGSRTEAVASWFAELGAFPLSPQIIVTAANGWSLVRPLDSGAWMTCAPLTAPAWSMAGNGTTVDAVFGPEAALMLLTQDMALIVDFVRDRVERFDTAGRGLGTLDIAHRQSAQGLSSIDAGYQLPAGPYARLGGLRTSGDLVIAVAGPGYVSLASELSSATLAAFHARDHVSTIPAPVITRDGYVGDWVRIRVLGPGDQLAPMALALNDTGDPSVEIWDWFRFLCAGSPETLLDEGSTPALPAAEVKDLDIVDSLATALAMSHELDVFDPETSTLAAYDEITLGLDGIPGAELSAVGLETRFRAEAGHVYIGTSTPADGRLVRFRVHGPGEARRSVTLVSGQPVIAVAAVGSAMALTEVYVRTSMNLEDPP